MYLEIRPHYSKTWGLSSVLNLGTSSTQVRRPTFHEPRSPEHGSGDNSVSVHHYSRKEALTPEFPFRGLTVEDNRLPTAVMRRQGEGEIVISPVVGVTAWVERASRAEARLEELAKGAGEQWHRS